MVQVNPVSSPLGASVIGEGTVNVVPDKVALAVGIESRGDNAVQALEATNLCMLQVIEALRHKGLSQGDIRTIWVGVYPYPAYTQAGQYPGQYQGATGGTHSAYAAPTGQAQNAAFNMYPQNMQAPPPMSGVGGYPPTYQSANVGMGTQALKFVASVWLLISLQEVNRTGEILDTALGAGAVYCGGQSFGLQDESAVRRAALDAASKDAKSKAEVLAAAMGRQLGKPVMVVEEYTVQHVGMQSSGTNHQMPGMPGGMTPNTGTSSPGGVNFTSRIRVSYELK